MEAFGNARRESLSPEWLSDIGRRPNASHLAIERLQQKLQPS